MTQLFTNIDPHSAIKVAPMSPITVSANIYGYEHDHGKNNKRASFRGLVSKSCSAMTTTSNSDDDVDPRRSSISSSSLSSSSNSWDETIAPFLTSQSTLDDTESDIDDDITRRQDRRVSVRESIRRKREERDLLEAKVSSSLDQVSLQRNELRRKLRNTIQASATSNVEAKEALAACNLWLEELLEDERSDNLRDLCETIALLRQTTSTRLQEQAQQIQELQSQLEQQQQHEEPQRQRERQGPNVKSTIGAILVMLVALIEPRRSSESVATLMRNMSPLMTRAATSTSIAPTAIPTPSNPWRSLVPTLLDVDSMSIQ